MWFIFNPTWFCECTGKCKWDTFHEYHLFQRNSEFQFVCTSSANKKYTKIYKRRTSIFWGQTCSNCLATMQLSVSPRRAPRSGLRWELFPFHWEVTIHWESWRDCILAFKDARYCWFSIELKLEWRNDVNRSTRSHLPSTNGEQLDIADALVQIGQLQRSLILFSSNPSTFQNNNNITIAAIITIIKATYLWDIVLLQQILRRELGVLGDLQQEITFAREFEYRLFISRPVSAVHKFFRETLRDEVTRFQLWYCSPSRPPDNKRAY